MSDNDNKEQEDSAKPIVVPDNMVLDSKGLTKAQINQAYKAFDKHLKPQHDNFMGYQCNELMDFQHLGKYLKLHMNNIGDPFTGGNFTVNTKQMEVAVLDYFAKIWHAKGPHSPHDLESYWGYVLSMGSTEGNMYGIWQARDYLQGKILFYEEEELYATTMKSTEIHGPTNVPFPIGHTYGKHQVHLDPKDKKKHKNSYRPIAFFSEDTHYSVTKICRVLDIPTFYDEGERLYPKHCPIAMDAGDKWPQTVPSDENGCVDVEKLLKLVEFFAEKGHPPLIVLNFGTTFKGAYDDVETIGNRLMPIFEKYGLDERTVSVEGRQDKRNGYWIHVDGALGGSYAPFLRMAAEQGKFKGAVPPRFDFQLPFVHSMNNSGHKWIGAPWPCGVFMTKVKYQMKPPSDPAYIGAPDTTFAGSRNAFSAMILWDHLAHVSYDQQIERALHSQNMVEYGVKKLTELSKKLGKKYGDQHHSGDPDQWLWVAHTPSALTIRFRKPADHVVKEFSLSGESMYVDVDGKKVARNFAHIYIMHHVNEKKIDHLVSELSKDAAWAHHDRTEMVHSEKGEGPAAKRQKTEDGSASEAYHTTSLKAHADHSFHAGSRGW